MRRVVEPHEDVAGVHVGVEEIVAKHLREEDVRRRSRPAAEVHAQRAQLVDVADRARRGCAPSPSRRAAQVPVHLGHVAAASAGEVAPQLRGVGRLAHQVQLVEDGLLVFARRPRPGAGGAPPASSARPAAPARTAPRGRAR